MNHPLALSLIALAFAGTPAFGQEHPDRWKLYDYGEERGWSNTNRNNGTVRVIDCENPGNKDFYRLTFVGVLERYMDDAAQKYWLSAHSGDHSDVVYAYTSLEYFDYLFLTTIPKSPSGTPAADLRLCARAIGAAEESCETFIGANLAELVADLCGAASP